MQHRRKKMVVINGGQVVNGGHVALHEFQGRD
jgi:hypothetical protein